MTKKNKNKIVFLNNRIGKWQQSTEWMDFFYYLGRFVESKKTINIYISYLDCFYPGILISIGILDKYYEGLSLNKKKILSDIRREIQLESDFVVKRGFENDEHKWMTANNLEVYMCPYFKEEVLQFDVKRAGQSTTKSTIPIDRWLADVRINGNYRKTAGAIVKLEDEMPSALIRELYNRKLSHLKMFNYNILNIFGHNFMNAFLDKGTQLSIKTKRGIYPLTDYIIFSNSNSNYNNARIINKNNFQQIREGETQMFFNANTALRFGGNYSGKNIYLTTRKHMDIESNTVLFANLDSKIVRKQRINNELIDYFQDLDIKIPKGVDIFAHE